MRVHRIASGALAALLVLLAVALVYWDQRVLAPALATDRATDLFKEVMPTATAGFAALREGRLALWNPYQLAGVPFLAVPYAGLLYPGQLAHLVLPPEIAIDVTEIAHLVFGGLCMWLLVARVGMGLASRYAAALTVMLSGWMGSQLHFPPLVQGMSWLPATVLAVDGCLRRRSPGAGQGWLPVLAVFVALQVLNGSTEFLLYNLYAAGLWAAFDLVPRLLGRSRGPAFVDAALVLAAIVLGCGLAGLQLLPSLELVSQSARSGGVSLAEARYMGTVAPGVFLADTLATTGEVAVGTLPLLGVVLGFRTRWRTVWTYALVLGGISVLLVFGDAVYEAYYATPLGQLFRRPNKWLHLYAFASAWMAALALARMEDWRFQGLQPRALWGQAGWRAAIAVLGAIVAATIAAAAWNPYFVLVLGCLLAFAAVSDPKLRAVCIVVLVVGQGADLFAATRGIWVRPSTHSELLHREDALFDSLAAARGDGRVHLSPAFKLDPGLTFKQGTLRGLPVVMDKQPLTMARHADFLAKAAGSARAEEGAARLTPDGPWQLLDLASTRFYVLERGEPLEALFAELARDPRATGVRRFRTSSRAQVYERTGWLPRTYAVGSSRFVESAVLLDALVDDAFDPEVEVLLEGEGPEVRGGDPQAFRASAAIVSDAPERIEIEVTASSPGFLVLTDSHYPGWRGEVDGADAEVLRANALFRAVRIPAGSSRVVFRYAPGSLQAGAWLSGVSALALIGLAAVGRHRRDG